MGNFETAASWLRDHLAAVLVAVFVVAALLAGWRVLMYHVPTRTLDVNGHTYSLEVTDTSVSRAQGLSGRTSLAADQGMLFVYDNPALQCFWMKDMNFPLDIIWLNAAKKVVHVEPKVDPSSYPHSFCGSDPAQYVIELNAGTAQTAGIHDGQTLRF